MRIGIDIFGGDYAPEVTVLGSILAAKSISSEAQIVLIGDQQYISSVCKREKFDCSVFDVVHTTEFIEMGDYPARAFAQKPNSSIVTGFKLLARGNLDGFASAGNTGAMMVGAMQIITSIAGIIRPAIAATIPNVENSHSLLLDVGLNPDARPDVLYQYGSIGTIYSNLVHGIVEPAVALLNVGIEESKGNMVTRSAYQLMIDSSNYNFVGNIEANEMFVSSRADVIVTDGFIGNMMLKQAEAFYKVVSLKQVANGYFEMFNYENFGGTPVLGVNAPLLIGHGISNDKAIKNMLLHTVDVVDADLVKRIKEELDR